MNILLGSHHIDTLTQVQNFLGCLLYVSSKELQNTAYMAVYIVDIITDATLYQEKLAISMKLHHRQVLYAIVEHYLMAVETL